MVVPCFTFVFCVGCVWFRQGNNSVERFLLKHSILLVRVRIFWRIFIPLTARLNKNGI